MSSIAPFQNPKSLIQRAPASGIFNTERFVGNQDAFVNRLTTYWLNINGNSELNSTPAHLDNAEKLYNFYLRYIQIKRSFKGNLGRVLHTLYSTGSVNQALTLLESMSFNYHGRLV